MRLSKKLKTFSQFFSPFSKSWSSFEHFETKMIFIANVFPKLETVKDMVRLKLGQPCFREPFDREHVKGSETLMKSAWPHFYHTFCSLLARYTGENFLLGIFSPIGLFVKISSDHKYSLRNSENLPETIQMQLSNILKTFSQHFVQLVQSTSKFKHFEEKTTLVAYVFSKLPAVKGTVT